MGTRENPGVVFRCSGCGFQGTYNQCNGHRMGAGKVKPECGGPPQMVSRTTGVIEEVPVTQAQRYEEEEEPEEYDRDEDDEEPDEGTTTPGRSQARLTGDRSPNGPRGAPFSGPVGVPASGASNIQPSTVRMTMQIPAILMALYDWARTECSYMGSFSDFVVEAALGYWTEEVKCPACDTPVSGFELAIVPLSSLSEERR